jgi:putative membrane protein
MNAHPTNRLPLALLFLTLLALFWSGIGPADRLTWVLEVLPVMIGLPLLLLSWSHFPLTSILYVLIFIHCLILMLGGHYTYSQVPLGFWVQDLFDLSRNHYDRLGHFMQGVTPAMLAREILIRRSPLPSGKWLFLIATSIALAFSALYEMIEWWTALLYGASADSFLATQGDIWDTQWDMFLALLGAITAQLLLTREHDRQLRGMQP